jgi:hypothetical protein
MSTSRRVHGRPAPSGGPVAPGPVASGPAGQPGPPVAAPPQAPRRPWWSRWAGPLAVALAGVVLFAAYLQTSRTQQVNSDGASQALQAWDMLHGNLLLHGWWLSDVSFYTTELPEYMLVEAVRGLNADVMHVGAAVTYTLLVLLAALLARGEATGRRAVARMLLAAGIVLAPQLGSGTYVLLLNPDHVGSSVVMMAILLLLDRAGRLWWVPAVTGVLLAWVLVADSIVLYTGVIPLLVACGTRVYQELVVRRQRYTQVRFELGLAAAAAVSVPVAMITTVLIHAHGGYYAWPAVPGLVTAAQAPGNLRIGLEGIALLFGCDLTGMKLGLNAAFALLHLIGLALACWAVLAGLRRFFRETSLVTRVLTVAVPVNLAGYLLSTTVLTPVNAREIAAILPFSAVLAGRLLADRLTATRLAPLLLAVLLGYGLALAHDAAQPNVPAQNRHLTTWLARHHFRYGLAGYWYASVVTLTSGGQVQVRPVCYGHQGFTTDRWEAQSAWYDPALHNANFLVTNPHGGYGGLHSLSHGGWKNCFPPHYSQVVAAFGQPAHVYRAGPDRVLVWDKNLLAQLDAAGKR